MSSPAVTIAWTPAEAVLFGPESRLVRLTMAEDDDRAALILETWRTEFPEIGSAQLLAGREADAPLDVSRLARLAADAGLTLELAPPPGPLRAGPASRWRAFRTALRPRVIAIIAAAGAALAAGGWHWSQVRERDRVGKLTAAERASELRRAESAEMGRKRQATSEQSRALLAACTAPRPFAGEWLAAIGAAASAAVVVEAIEISGAHCRISGRTVTGAPGAESAAENFKSATFPPAAGWMVEPSAGPRGKGASSFRFEATARGPAAAVSEAEDLQEAAEAARARLPDEVAAEALIKTISSAWEIQLGGITRSRGISLRRYSLTAMHSDERAWPAAQALTRRLGGMPGSAIEAMTLGAAPGENGGLEKAAFEITLRVRAGR